jgi:outer membrane protein assembly factor BamB
MSSPVLVDGRIFLVDDDGIASCIDAKSGESLWRERLDGEFAASPIHAHGRIYFFDTEGGAKIVRASEHYVLLAKNQLDEGCMASPVVAGKAILLRTKTHLYRIEE